MTGGQEHRRILLVRPDHLGDVLLTLPAVTALRAALPQAHISYLVRPAVAEILRRCPAVDEVLTAPFPPLDIPIERTDWHHTAPTHAASLRGRFDLAVLARPDDPWSARLVEESDIGTRLGYGGPRTRASLTDSVSVPTWRHASELAHRLVEIASVLAGARTPVRLETPADRYLVLQKGDHLEAERFLAGYPRTGARPIVIHPGSGWALKSWPVERWSEVVREIRRTYRCSPLVLGSEAEGSLVEGIVRRSGDAACGSAGALSLGGLAALHSRAAMVLGVDSGALHLAALMGAPVVGLYGPAGPEQFGPLAPPERVRTVRVHLPCSPCGTLLDPPCGAIRDPACMTGIPAHAVLDAVSDLLGRRGDCCAGCCDR